MPEFTGQDDLRGYLRTLWRWKWLFLVFVIAAPLVAYVVERGKPKVYRSTALVGINQGTVNTTLLSGGGSFTTSNVTAIAQLVKTTPVAVIAAHQMHPPANPGQVVGEVSASGDLTTNFLTISALDRSPTRAADIANAFAAAISRNRQEAAIAELDDAISGINGQLSQLSKSDRATRPQLEQQLHQLRAARLAQGSQAAVLQAATPSASPAGPNTRRAVELGLVIGLLLAIGAIALAENSDRRLRTPADLERATNLPLLATIESSAFSEKLETSKEDEEAFQMLRASLTYFDVDSKEIKSIVIASAGEKDGKTTVATRLALVMASAGMRVILVDADLRRARVSARLGLETPQGLGSVLAGEHMLDEELIEYATTGPGSLWVLPAGRPPPNPAALMSSDKMQHLLWELEARSDLVILDTPAALAVSDALPLLGSVSGVVLVARMNRSRREAIRRLQGMIASAHGTPLGVVATGATSGPGYDHYSPKYYTQNGSSGSSGRRGWRRKRKAGATNGDVLLPKPQDAAASGATVAAGESAALPASDETAGPAVSGEPTAAAASGEPDSGVTTGE